MPSEALHQASPARNGFESSSLNARRRRMENRRSKISSANGPLSEPSIKRLRHAYYTQFILNEQILKFNHLQSSSDSTLSSFFEPNGSFLVPNSSIQAETHESPTPFYFYRFLKHKIEKLGSDSESDSEDDRDETLDAEINVENLELDNVSTPQEAVSEKSFPDSTNMDIDPAVKPVENVPPITAQESVEESMDISTNLDTVSSCRTGHRFGKPADECPAHGSHSICGRRREMEDAVATVPCFAWVPCESATGCQFSTRNVPENSPSNHCKLHFFGVYDGHGGYQAAHFCSRQLHKNLANEIRQTVRLNSEDSIAKKFVWKKIFTDTFKKTDFEIEPIAPETVGSTAVVTVISPSQIIVSNCGDSRAVLSRAGKAIPLSKDHKPDREDEMQRIEAAGGRVIFWNGFRVLGVLAMSRALGDRYLKPYVIPEPDLTFTPRSYDDECIVMATDGLWDVLSNDSACEIARRYLNHDGSENLEPDGFESETPAVRAAAILTRIALTKGSGDNISVIVIDLKSLHNH